MHIVAYACMVFGAIIAVTGIVLFVKMGTQGTSSIKMFGFEFQLGGSALVVFVVGILLFIVPVIYGDRLLEKEKPVAARDVEPTRGRTSSGNDQPASSAFVILNNYGELRVSQGLFLTLDECRARIKVLADSTNYARCDAAPDEVFCISYYDEPGREFWECNLGLNQCKETLELEDLEAEAGGKRRVTTRCERIAFSQALPKLR